MTFSLRRPLWTALKYGISLLGLFYAFHDVPLETLWDTLKRYPPLPMLSVLLVSFTAYALMGLRLSRMIRPHLRFSSTFCATLVGLAVNNVLPAKAGEVAKAVWIGRENDVPVQKAFGLVLMERFFDVNVLALLSFWFLWMSGGKKIVLAFTACLLLGWAVLFAFRKKPFLMESFTLLLGKGRIKAFADQVLEAVVGNMTARRLVWLALTSLAVWFFYSLQMVLGIKFVAGFDMRWGEIVSVFAVSGLSMLLPSSPGAIGVYEAFTVTVLRHYGVSQEEALALALFTHMAQFIPVTLTGGLIFAFSPEAKRNRRDGPDGEM